MTKREAELKSKFGEEWRRRVPDSIVLMFASAGAPDRSITANTVTTHWEFKHGTPDISTDGLQELTCMKLAMYGHCRYVIWLELPPDNQRTLIVHPRYFHEWMKQRRVGTFPRRVEAFCDGFDHRWLVHQVMIAHEL